MTHRWQGIAYALLSAALFGASTPFAKALLGEIGPWMLAGLLYLGSGLGLAVLHLVHRLRGGLSAEAPLARRDLPWLAAVVLAGGVAGPVLLMQGLSTTPASTASLLLNLEGLFTLGIAWVVFRENVDRRIALGAAAILAGAVLLSWGGGGNGGPESVGQGGLFIAAACLAWGIDNNLTRKLSSADPLQIAMVKGMAAGVVNSALALSAGAALPSPGLLAGAAVIGFLGYGISLALFVLALRHLGSARTGAYFSLAPFVGAAAAILAFGEPLTLRFVAAAALMGVGLYLHLVERHEHEHRHEATEHEHRHTHDEHHQHEHEGWEGPEPHSHPHAHAPLVHAHPHFPDIHHRHPH
ncbi:DMT family transporter [Azospirillum soli]|uniref:DMT family transporter n=1 Tax=Azospirillum soli TaxID=1304799 RepID=UPI001AE4FADF|nr:drug/metabolite transporter (DMT)-like permease [Azospirillum soli]